MIGAERLTGACSTVIDVGSRCSRYLRRNPRNVACRVTLLTFVVYGPGSWSMELPLVMLAAIGLAIPAVGHNRGFWLATAVILAVGILPRLYVIDNHKVLMVYWALALAICSHSKWEIRQCARWLIGLVFGFASFWKWVTPDFFGSGFLHYTIIRDPRFATFANWTCGVPPESLAHNRGVVQALYSGLESMVYLRDTPSTPIVAALATFATLAIETSIAVGFLLPRRFTEAWRDWVLMAFVVMTYPVAPVMGFAWLLLIMGMVQCGSRPPWRRAAYLCLLVATQLFLVPWRQILT